MTHDNELGKRIVRLIAAQGPISVAQFMTIALHDPQSGYYATRDPFRRDFITAPEISPIFGELIGLWCAQVWHDAGRPKPAWLVELGPGRGTLMCHALRAARLMPEFLAAIEVVLVETSPVLADAQKDALKSCDVPVRWVQSVDTLAQDRAQFTIANEFLDVLPVQQFVFTGKGWCERMVGLDADGTLTLALAPSASPIAVSSERGQPSIGAIYEVSRAAIAIVEDIARGIATCGGAALFIDYGYDGRGFGETLQAVGANQFRDVLATPGSVDISAHVDFGAMARAAEVGGAKAYGPVSQGALLESLGIGNHAGARAATSAVDRLTSADQMGTLFKALAIVSPPAATPPGFEE